MYRPENGKNFFCSFFLTRQTQKTLSHQHITSQCLPDQKCRYFCLHRRIFFILAQISLQWVFSTKNEIAKNDQFLEFNIFFGICCVKMILTGVLVHEHMFVHKKNFSSWPTSFQYIVILAKFQGFSKKIVSVQEAL